MSRKCPGSGMEPAGTTSKGPIYPSGRIVALRGVCPICGGDVSINKPGGRKPRIRVHQKRQARN